MNHFTTIHSGKIASTNALFFKRTIIIFLFFTPWLLAFYPGIIIYDSCGQLLMSIYHSFNDHHPLFSSLIMYCSLIIGRNIFHSDNIGIFLFVLVQVILLSVAIACCFDLFDLKNTSKHMKISIFLFYCVLPVIPNISILFSKDSAYAVSVLLCFVTTQLCFLPIGGSVTTGPRVLHRILWCVSLLGLCIFRHEGKIMALIILLLLILFTKQRRLALKGLCIVLCFIIINRCILFGLRAQKGSVREMLSLPALITATYIDEYYEEMTDDELKNITSIFDVDDLQTLPNYIDYNLSDPLKNNMYYSISSEALLRYFSTFAQDSFKHPTLYFSAFRQHINGYINPFHDKYESDEEFLYIMGSESRIDNRLNIYFSGISSLKLLLRKWVLFWSRNYITRFLYRPGTYTITLLIASIFLLFKKKHKMLLWLVPAYITLIILFLSPLNGSLRYAFPLIITMPLYCEFTLNTVITAPHTNQGQ